jgi:UDP-N-acetyl-D-mannosaminuronic acid dehydrogenase
MSINKVCVIGLGYIGLPTAALIANNNMKVVGVDTNRSVVDIVNSGHIHINEPDLEIVVKRTVSNESLKASLKPVLSDCYIIVVPTPFKERNEPDITYVEEATRSILPLLKAGDLFIIESTSPVGTTEKMTQLIYNERPELQNKLFITYCPERVLPGNIMHELVNNDRVIGGIDEKSSDLAVLFYKKFVRGSLHKTNSRTAEMCKLVENSSRDVQVAFANELSLICNKANVDVWELINLANKHPRVKILQPGCGVGGHCIAVDPYFIVADYPMESKLISKAREINNYKSFWCVEKILKTKVDFEKKNGFKPKIALMGLAFKPNIEDMRESPAKYIAQKILENAHKDEIVFVVEPNVKISSNFKLVPYKDAYEYADIIVFLVAHNEFKNLINTNDKLILDFCGVLTNFNSK